MARGKKSSFKKPHNETTKKAAVENNAANTLIYPGGDTAFKALLSARFCAAIWSHVTDCDETFNYWEPMHYLVFGKGLQTWEYSPEFALRSYLYLLVHAFPAYVYHKLLQPNPLLIFYFVRCLLGLFCSLAEVYFYKAVCREFGVHVGRMCLAFQLFAAGMFVSSAAFLPSSWAMCSFMCACAAWWQQRYPLAVFFVALGSLLGWPFAVLLGLPIAFDMLVLKRLYRVFFAWAAISGMAILGPMVAIDSAYFGTLVVAPWNIVKYNVFGGSGSELYGTEPFSYYLVNGFLNYNIVWLLALVSPIAVMCSHFLVPAKNRSTFSQPYLLSLSPLFLWLAVFLVQPHKEERFLYPIYPMISLAGSVTVDIVQKLVCRLLKYLKATTRGHYLDSTSFVMFAALVASGLLGLSRSFSLYRNYHAPLELMMELGRFSSEPRFARAAEINLCVGKDWHRFPSSYFLPASNWNVRFVRSEFRGLLPSPYTAYDAIHSHFNDGNEEEESVYFDLNRCHFMLDLDLGRESELEPVYAKRKDMWTGVKSLPFLNAERSNSFFRSFYVPFVSDWYVTFGNFSLLQSNKIKLQ